MQAVVELVGEFVTGESERGEQIGATDVADEECIAGQHAVRHGIVGVFPHDDADRLGRVAGCVADLEEDVAERDALTIRELARRELGGRHRRESDLGARGVREFEVAGQEVGMEVGLDHELDGEPGLGGVANVLVDVAPWVDHDSTTGGLVADQV